VGVRNGSQALQPTVELAVLGQPFSEPGPWEHENCWIRWKVCVKLLRLLFAGGSLLRSSPELAAEGSVVQHCSRRITRTARQQLLRRARSKFSRRSTESWTDWNLTRKDLKRPKRFDFQSISPMRSVLKTVCCPGTLRLLPQPRPSTLLIR
jgi:hypothetical protein